MIRGRADVSGHDQHGRHARSTCRDCAAEAFAALAAARPDVLDLSINAYAVTGLAANA